MRTVWIVSISYQLSVGGTNCQISASSQQARNAICRQGDFSLPPTHPQRAHAGHSLLDFPSSTNGRQHALPPPLPPDPFPFLPLPSTFDFTRTGVPRVASAFRSRKFAASFGGICAASRPLPSPASSAFFWDHCKLKLSTAARIDLTHLPPSTGRNFPAEGTTT